MSALRGRLITATFVRDGFRELPGTGAPTTAFLRDLERWWERVESALGPAAAVRAITEAAVLPLLRVLDLTVERRVDSPDRSVIHTRWRDRAGPSVLVVPWGAPLSSAWRLAVLDAIVADTRWILCVNGTALRIVDAHRTWSRDFCELDLTTVARDVEAAGLLRSLLHGSSIAADRPVLDRAVELSARYGLDVCRALGAGVLDALAIVVAGLHERDRPRRRPGTPRRPADPPEAVFEGSVTLLYRVLFLLFAEARGLVPIWHPIYRDRYTLDAIMTALISGRTGPGLWHALQAISRLAQTGVTAGDLTVNAFNGRLFSPRSTAIIDRAPLPDAVLGSALTAVGTRSTRAGERRRILYRDLDVEQLGAVYEQILEYDPASSFTAGGRIRTRDVRKASGTFYTPRPVTAFLVRRTLGPLVQGRSSEAVLALRVLDPAMGSGAFLVEACRVLASALEDALVREGHLHPADITPADRAALRRDVASRCLYGVDINPMAVQLGRLSLWLATLSADRPLSFLDHHLVPGDSLVGATPRDVQLRPTRLTRRRERPGDLPLFDSTDLEAALQPAVRTRIRLGAEADDTAATVRRKEQVLASLCAGGTPLDRWRRLLDLWCAGWFLDDEAAMDRALFTELAVSVMHDRTSLPRRSVDARLEQARVAADARRFLHWPLTFPEIFADEDGRELPSGGFDAVIGNPPWDMVRGDSGAGDLRSSRRDEARRLSDFARESGVYRVETRSHVNRYQLFVERALQLVRPGGRIGFVLPSGIVSDAGASALRRHLFDRADVDTITGLDNRAGIFPIHRSVRFALLTCTAGWPTAAVACRFGLSDPEMLEGADAHARLVVSRRFLSRLSGEDDLGLPEFASATDFGIVERISATTPWLGEARGWNVRFGRELNASDDRGKFREATGAPTSRPVLEGKQIEPFRVLLDGCRLELRPDVTMPARLSRRTRIAYRDIASATNRLTLIAAVVPARAVTTHTLFCLKTELRRPEQHVLCALMNSFVANYIIRMRVNTHVTVALVSRLPVPLVSRDHPSFGRLLVLSRALARRRVPLEEMHEYAEMQALAAHLYRLTRDEFEHVLSTFPLVKEDTRSKSLDSFDRLTPSTRHRGTETRRP